MSIVVEREKGGGDTKKQKELVVRKGCTRAKEMIVHDDEEETTNTVTKCVRELQNKNSRSSNRSKINGRCTRRNKTHDSARRSGGNHKHGDKVRSGIAKQKYKKQQQEQDQGQVYE